MLRRLGVLVLTTALLGLTACSDDGSGLPLTGGAGSMRGLLATLPVGSASSESGVVVYLADFEAARRQLGIDAPLPDASEDDFVDYVQALTFPTEGHAGMPWPEGLGQRALVQARPAYEQQLGIALGAIDGYAELSALPSLVTVARGDFSRDRIEEAVESDPSWSEDLDRVEHGGTEYWSWLEDEELDLSRVDETHVLGESTRLALVDGWLVRTRITADMEATLDALGDGDSLADDDVFASLADGLDSADAVAGALTTDVASYSIEGVAGREATPEVIQRLEEETPTLAAYQGLGVGLAFGDGGVDDAFVVVVLDHADAETAADNVGRLGQILEDGTSFVGDTPWSDVFQPESIEADGTRLVARLGVDLPGYWLTPLQRPDTLLIHD